MRPEPSRHPAKVKKLLQYRNDYDKLSKWMEIVFNIFSLDGEKMSDIRLESNETYKM